MFGREISRGLIAALRADGLIAAGPRSPKIGAPYAYVTTEKYLMEFGFESLRDLPGIEALKDAGLTPTGGQLGATKGNRRRRTPATGYHYQRLREIASGSSIPLPRLGSRVESGRRASAFSQGTV